MHHCRTASETAAVRMVQQTGFQQSIILIKLI